MGPQNIKKTTRREETYDVTYHTDHVGKFPCVTLVLHLQVLVPMPLMAFII